MIHQPLGGAQGQATEIEIAANRILFLREKLNGILAERTGQPLEVIEHDTDRDNFMTAEILTLAHSRTPEPGDHQAAPPAASRPLLTPQACWPAAAPAARRCAVRVDQASEPLPQAHRPHGAEPRRCRRRHASVRSLVAPGSHAAAGQTVAAAARRRRRRLPVRPARCAVERPEGRGEGGWRLGERRLPGRPARSVPALPRAPRHPGRPDADRDPGLAAHQRRPDGRQPVRRRDSPPRSGKPTPAPASRSSGSSSSPPGPNPPSGSSTWSRQR